MNSWQEDFAAAIRVEMERVGLFQPSDEKIAAKILKIFGAVAAAGRVRLHGSSAVSYLQYQSSPGRTTRRGAGGGATLPSGCRQRLLCQEVHAPVLAQQCRTAYRLQGSELAQSTFIARVPARLDTIRIPTEADLVDRPLPSALAVLLKREQGRAD